MINQTSLESYLKLQEEGKLNENQTIVLDVFKVQYPQPLSYFDLSKLLNWSSNRITGRVKELLEKGKLERLGYKIWQAETNRNVFKFKLKRGGRFKYPHKRRN